VVEDDGIKENLNSLHPGKLHDRVWHNFNDISLRANNDCDFIVVIIILCVVGQWKFL